MKESGYDKIAFIYDDLVGFIFGKEFFDAQCIFFKEIPPRSNVLILGGGTGWIIHELEKLNGSCSICYIDSSTKMIELSKKKQKGKDNDIHWILGTEEDIPSDQTFDVVITHFYIDLFLQNELPHKIETIDKSLKSDGIWLVADFLNSRHRKHRFLLWLMKLFFKYVVGHSNIQLFNWEETFLAKGFIIKKERVFNHGFIKSIVFKRMG